MPLAELVRGGEGSLDRWLPGQCPICGHDAKRVESYADNHSIAGECARCGRFDVSEQAWYAMNAGSEVRRRVQWYNARVLNPRHSSGKTRAIFCDRAAADKEPGSVTVEEICDSHFPSDDEEKLRDLLEVLRIIEPRKGHKIKFSEADEALFWFEDDNELAYYIQIARNRGLIEGWSNGQYALREEGWRALSERHTRLLGAIPESTNMKAVDKKSVFVIHGRDRTLTNELYTFLRAIGLNPIEWSQAVARTGKPTPDTWEVVEVALREASAIVVLLSPDEEVALRRELRSSPEEDEQGYQPRPNVLYEAGVAIGRSPERVVVIRCGKIRPISDIAGMHILTVGQSEESRNELCNRLASAGCDVDKSGAHWLTAGRLVPDGISG